MPVQMQVNMMDVGSERVTFSAETYAIQGRFGFFMPATRPLPPLPSTSFREPKK